MMEFRQDDSAVERFDIKKEMLQHKSWVFPTGIELLLILMEKFLLLTVLSLLLAKDIHTSDEDLFFFKKDVFS